MLKKQFLPPVFVWETAGLQFRLEHFLDVLQIQLLSEAENQGP
jgi:hypothetical protein